MSFPDTYLKDEVSTAEPLVFPPLDPHVPRPLSPVQEEVLRLKRERGAVILAHNYQVDEIQQVADFVGDSLGLAYKAAETAAEVIAFCGVHFMAETAKIVNPTKTVLLPEPAAGCSLSDSCPAEQLAAYKAAHPNLYVAAYINCSADVKAISDVICTSGNAARIIGLIPPDREILFVPDQNLGQWVSKQTGRAMRLWPGSCYAHVLYSVRAIENARARFPSAPVVAHPECVEAVRDTADIVCSTEKMVAYCRENPAQTFIIVTETGMINRLRREVPGKTFVAGPTDSCGCNDCRFMKMNSIEKLRDCLLTLEPRVELSASIAAAAAAPIQRMLEWSR
ncbi:MAG: quinolinate synthase NadA [Puniceicoccales bacterium]|jgi:quinolinate synthase|nr:quinolinate synthase NadA [Puniceicoccales bacterium]